VVVREIREVRREIYEVVRVRGAEAAGAFASEGIVAVFAGAFASGARRPTKYPLHARNTHFSVDKISSSRRRYAAISLMNAPCALIAASCAPQKQSLALSLSLVFDAPLAGATRRFLGHGIIAKTAILPR
jgi:hypothetical protein